MDWWIGFFLPLIKVLIVGAIILPIGFYVFRGIYRSWKQGTKWTLKYTIFRRKMPEPIVQWCIDAIDNGVGYYDAKKLLYVNNGTNMEQVWETLWIYDKIILDLNKLNKKTGGNKDGRKFERGYSKIERTELPTTESESKSS